MTRRQGQLGLCAPEERKVNTYPTLLLKVGPEQSTGFSPHHSATRAAHHRANTQYPRKKAGGQENDAAVMTL